tara:strand:- start:10 stop:315 length:306 start_codon:yes stop_codon:yes gene_type:complete
MAHFAKIEDDIVTQVIVAEQAYIDTLSGTWVQTSYNASIRKNYAGIGYTYDSSKDAFIAPKPHASWTLNNTTCKWEAPIAFPTDEKSYRWDEDTTNWKEIE